MLKAMSGLRVGIVQSYMQLKFVDNDKRWTLTNNLFTVSTTILGFWKKNFIWVSMCTASVNTDI